jgi:hypothetical protein
MLIILVVWLASDARSCGTSNKEAFYLISEIPPFSNDDDVRKRIQTWNNLKWLGSGGFNIIVWKFVVLEIYGIEQSGFINRGIEFWYLSEIMNKTIEELENEFKDLYPRE